MATSVASLASRPMVALARWTRLRAIVFGRYPSSAAAARIRSSVSTETRTSPPLRTLLAVWKLTPARAATSLIDTYRRRAIASFRRVLVSAHIRPRHQLGRHGRTFALER